jgi:hypothetical protein
MISEPLPPSISLSQMRLGLAQKLHLTTTESNNLIVWLANSHHLSMKSRKLIIFTSKARYWDELIENAYDFFVR